jgi:sugar/nucleoside kinase (ribokinase family)
MEARTFDVLVVGDLNPDIVVLDKVMAPVFGQVETLVEGIRLTIGGSAGIMACGVARLGLSVAVCGVVGDDDLGRWMLASLAARGVDTRHCVVEAVFPTGATVILARGADRAILTALGTIDRLRAADVPLEMLSEARHVHAASTALQPHLRSGLPAVFRAARSAGATSSFDTNWDPAERWDGIDGLLSTADICFPNLEEGRRWTGASEPAAVGRALAARAAANRDPDAGPLTVALKLGADGALAVRGHELVRVRARRVPVIDTVGAGDSFDAGFVGALVSGWPLDEALALAVACGSASTRAMGGVDGQATLHEAAELMR